MQIDFQEFNIAYESLAIDLIKHLQKIYKKYKISTYYKHYSIDEGNIPLFVEDKTFLLDIDTYLEDYHHYGPTIAFKNLEEHFDAFLLQEVHS